MPFGRRSSEDEFDAEFQGHIDMHTADNIRAGMSPEEPDRLVMVVGASTGSVMRAIALGGQRLALIGLALGLAVSWMLSRTIETLLHGVTPSDPLTYAGAGLLLWLVAFLACAIPALRAARVSPAALLRGN